jgi:glycosyltransferase involved in cell wall biosynthesis
MKITFGMIVFNAESTLPSGMLEACITNVYEIAHEIIIVEGATKAVTHYFDGDTSNFTSDGKSTDNTVNILKSIPDPLNKIKIVESRGFWNGKTEMCNEWAKIATGDYVWQLDSDEFYHVEDMIKLKNYLQNHQPDAVYFNAYHFFGGLDYCIDERSYPEWGSGPWYRVFKNKPGKSKWLSHEHPIYECDGKVCNNGVVLNQTDSTNLGIKMYHYSYITESQILFKTLFYKNNTYPESWRRFQVDKQFKPLGAQTYKFQGNHPNIIKKLFHIQ